MKVLFPEGQKRPMKCQNAVDMFFLIAVQLFVGAKYISCLEFLEFGPI